MSRPKKNPFADLDQPYKDSIAAMDEAAIRKLCSDVALAEHENRQNQAKDEDLKEKKEAVKMAAEQYTEATKMNKQRIAYAHYILESKGKI